MDVFRQQDPISGGRFEIRKFGAKSEPIEYGFGLYRMVMFLTSSNSNDRTFFSSHNCSVINPPKGSILIHPGRITHRYEELSDSPPEIGPNDNALPVILDSLINVQYLWTMAGANDYYEIPGFYLQDE